MAGAAKRRKDFGALAARIFACALAIQLAFAALLNVSGHHALLWGEPAAAKICAEPDGGRDLPPQSNHGGMNCALCAMGDRQFAQKLFVAPVTVKLPQGVGALSLKVATADNPATPARPDAVSFLPRAPPAVS
jgi:hypothetical protein